MRSIDEDIARRLAAAAASGELQQAPSYGKPLAEAEGWADTPEALRLPFKILRDAGVVPREVEMFRERAALRAELTACGDPEQQRTLQRRLAELEQAIALRLEALRIMWHLFLSSTHQPPTRHRHLQSCLTFNHSPQSHKADSQACNKQQRQQGLLTLSMKDPLLTW